MGSLRPLISLSRGCSQLDVAAVQSGRLTKGHSMLMSASNSCLGKLKTNCVLMGPAGADSGGAAVNLIIFPLLLLFV